MTVRTDIEVSWEDSPRIIQVLAPSTELTIQDLVDTCRFLENRVINMDDPALISAAGKEALGGGVTVGITATLQNAQVQFAARSVPAEMGACTQDDAEGVLLIAAGGQFQTNNIERGFTVFNTVTGDMAVVLEVLSETELRSQPVTGGAGGGWTSGNSYVLYDNVQCNVSGGNLVALDDVGADLSPFLQAPNTNVVRTSSSSATLQELADIQYASFNGGISYDETSPYAGTVYPTGTPRQPVNNPNDAYAIALDRGFNTGFILHDMTAPTAFALHGFNFIGSGKDRSLITLPDAADISECAFIDARITGYLDGDCTLRDCMVEDLYYVKGFVEQCVLAAGTIELAGSDEAHFLDCWSGVPGEETPIIDCGGSGQALAMRNYNGGVRLINKTGPEKVSIDLNSGQIRLDLITVLNGLIVARGIGKLVDHATGESITSGTYGSLQIVNETVNSASMAEASWRYTRA